MLPISKLSAHRRAIDLRLDKDLGVVRPRTAAVALALAHGENSMARHDWGKILGMFRLRAAIVLRGTALNVTESGMGLPGTCTSSR